MKYIEVLHSGEKNKRMFDRISISHCVKKQCFRRFVSSIYEHEN